MLRRLALAAAALTAAGCATYVASNLELRSMLAAESKLPPWEKVRLLAGEE